MLIQGKSSNNYIPHKTQIKEIRIKLQVDNKAYKQEKVPRKFQLY